MKNPTLYEFYEKLYFHEVEAREQMTIRLQVPLALLISTIGLLGFMAQNLERGLNGFWSHAFFLFFLVAAGFIFASGYHCVRSAWGHEYSMLPVATSWNDYHAQCLLTYTDFPNVKKLAADAVQIGVCSKYVECAAANATINELRSFHYHMTIKYFIVAVVLGFLAFVSFFFGALDKGSHTKPTGISIVSPVQLKGVVMATQQPIPSPPPPPPTRHVRDDKRPPPPQPRGTHGN